MSTTLEPCHLEADPWRLFPFRLVQLRRSALTDILKDNEGGRPLQTTNQQDLLDWSNMPAAEVHLPCSQHIH